MKLFLSILLTFLIEFGFSQNSVPGFEIQNSNSEINSTLGGSYVLNENRTDVINKKDLVFVTEMNDGDFILFEINKNDKKDYALELINKDGDIIINISNFNSSSFKIVKNNLGNGEFTVHLTEKKSQIVDIGSISL